MSLVVLCCVNFGLAQTQRGSMYKPRQLADFTHNVPDITPERPEYTPEQVELENISFKGQLRRTMGKSKSQSASYVDLSKFGIFEDRSKPLKMMDHVGSLYETHTRLSDGTFVPRFKRKRK